MIDRLIRLEEVLSYTGLSRSELYRKVQVGEFPRPVKVGKRAVRWRESEVDGWITERPRTVLQ
ncbi:MAG: AlpA family transcriptional regulator [Chloroflexota bacterium]|nr:AlpA family transcriptional regulator [Chloroflexota bacterium]